VTPDGKVVSGSDDNILIVWDLLSGLRLRSLEGHTDGVTAVAVTPDGKAISGARDNTLKVWDLNSAQLLSTLTFERDVLSCAVAPDGRTIVAGDSAGHVHFLRLGRAVEL